MHTEHDWDKHPSGLEGWERCRECGCSRSSHHHFGEAPAFLYFDRQGGLIDRGTCGHEPRCTPTEYCHVHANVV